jgi:hypothetical protein
MLLKTCLAVQRLVAIFALVFIGLAGQTGCGSGGVKLAKVTGKVTLAGAPLADALVTFNPVDGGSPSAGRTSSDGSYSLEFSRKMQGAMVGEHTVTISTLQPALEEPPTPEVPEKVPFKYREPESTLKATVKSGSNKIDFALENGPIEPPVSKTKKKAADTATCY